MAHNRDTRHAAERPDRDAETTPSPETLLGIFSDEYARELLDAMRNESKSARTLAEDCGMSRPTVYRRLNRLREAGLITEQIAVGDDGHHRRRFSVAVETVGISLGDTGFDADVTVDEHHPATH